MTDPFAPSSAHARTLAKAGGLPPLDITDYRLLKELEEVGGQTTAQAARNAGLPTGRKQTQIIRHRILYLKKHGLVTELDDQKPAAWVRTKLGTEAWDLYRSR